MIPLTPTIVLGALLAASVAGNGILGKAWLGARDDAARASEVAAQQMAAAQQCSDGVASLQTAAEDRAKAAEADRAAALKLAQDATRRAQALLARKPTVPGDNCASARVQIDDWLSTRRPR